MRQYHFYTNADFVAAREEFAEDMITFVAHTPELIITLLRGEPSQLTKEWLRRVAEVR